MVRQHDPAGPDPDRRRARREIAGHDGRRGARDRLHVVVLGDPVALVAEPLGVAREVEAVAQRVAGGRPARDRGEVEDGEGNRSHLADVTRPIWYHRRPNQRGRHDVSVVVRAPDGTVVTIAGGVRMSGAASFTASDAIDLLEWKHAIFDLYAGIRAAPEPEQAWRDWRATRDRMYRDHPQSPIPAAARADFAFCRFYDYDPAWRTIAVIENADPDPTEIAASTGGTFSFTRIGVARFVLQGQEHELELAWNDGYGGGIFLAFTDETSGAVDLRRRPLSHRHRQGRRSRLRRRRRHGGARLQLRLQPLVLVRRTLGVPARARRQPACRSRSRRASSTSAET